MDAETWAIRKTAIGSSDMAAILGLSRWKGPIDVWLEKTDRVGVPDDSETSPAAAAGKLLESGVMDWAQQSLGPMERQARVVHPSAPLASTVDGVVLADGRPVEAKTAGIVRSRGADAWGEHGTDEIPQDYIVQCMVHIAVTGSDLCHVPALIGGRGFLMYVVKRDDALVHVIEDTAGEFWDKYVKTDTRPPHLEGPKLETVQRMIRVPKKVIEIGQDFLRNWLDKREALRQAEEAEKAAKVDLIASMMDAEETEAIHGLGRVSYREQSRDGGVDVSRLRSEWPDVYAAIKKPATTYRVLRHHAAKETDR